MLSGFEGVGIGISLIVSSLLEVGFKSVDGTSHHPGAEALRL